MQLASIPNSLFSRAPKMLTIAVSLVLLTAIGYVDKVTDVEIGFSVFYVIPILLATWYVGRGWGLLCAVLSTAALILADVVDAHAWTYPAAPFWNATVHMGFFIIIVAILAMLKDAYAREQLLSRTDPLTGAMNKRHFDEVLAVEVDRARRYRHPLTFASIDADNFKSVNDRFGHAAGDALLQAVVRTLHADLREFDAVGRLGGDEFAVLLPEAGEEQAVQIFERIRGTLRDEMGRNGWPVTFSIGLATWPDPPATCDDLARRADTLMYEAKKAGKDAIRHEVCQAGAGT